MAFAKTITNVFDRTLSGETVPLGRTAFAGKTQRGTVGKAQLVRSVAEFRRLYGNELDPTVSVFPILAMRALRLGAQLVISRVEHLSDINDINTQTATAASGNNGGVFSFSERAFAVDTGTNQITIQGDFSYSIVATQSHTILYQGGGSGVLTVSAVTYSGGYTTITYTTTVSAVTVGDSVTWSFTGTNTLSLTAANVGSWGNSVSFEIKRSAANVANTVDIVASLVGSPDLTETFRNMPTTPSATDITRFNDAMKLVQWNTHTAPITRCPAVTLTGGTDDYASVTDLDYEGSAFSNTGLHAFDELTDIVKIAVPEIATNAMDLIVYNYTIGRGVRELAVLHAPETLTGYGAIDYRNCTGAYSGGTKIDSWRAVMLYGGLKIISPFDNQTPITISWVGDFIGLSAAKDNATFPWFSISGIDSTPLDALDIEYNLNTTSRLQEAEDVTDNGLFPIIRKRIGGSERIIAWGDRNMQVADSRLRFFNVSELLITIANACRPISEGALFKPNDPLTWKAVYRKVDALMRQVQANRGVNAYIYEGDQNAENKSQAVVNTAASIAAGKYRFNLYLDPITTINEVEQNFILAELAADGSGIVVENVA